MATTKPFLFDSQTFEDGSGGGASVYSQEQLDQAVQQAREIAAEEAHSAAMATVESEVQNSLQRLEMSLSDLIAGEATRVTELQKGATEVCMTIVRKLLPGLVEENALSSIASFIQHILAERFEEQRLVVRVSPQILDKLKERIDQLSGASPAGGKIILLPEPALPVGDCRIEWADGGAERDTARLYQDVEHAVEQFLTTRSSSLKEQTDE